MINSIVYLCHIYICMCMCIYMFMYVYTCTYKGVYTFQTFDRYRCTQLVMECLCKFEDDAICRMSLAVISILAAKVSSLSVKYFVLFIRAGWY